MTYEVASIQDVDITSKFWSHIQRCSRETTLPSIIHTQKSLDHWSCLTWKEGHEVKPHPFWDSDIYKVIEAACYFLQKQKDANLMAVVEEAVDMIRNAQYQDGYISSYFTVHGIANRWTNIRDMHELYCIGHLLEATVAYEELTNSSRLKEVAIKVIDHVASVFGPASQGQKPGYPGHQEMEIGLLRFYELTAYRPAFNLAKYFIMERGKKDAEGEIYYDKEAKARGADPYDDMGTEHKAWYHGCRDYGYQQADCPIVEATEIKGHAVRAMYYFTATTDLVRLSPLSDKDAPTLHQSLKRLWRDLIDRKIYITGGIGNVANNEGFGPPFLLGDLEDQGCYAETCATFALINWCQRLLRIELNSEYADIIETCLYNGFLGAVSVDGDAFYYQNVMRTLSGKPKERSRWFGVACCPPNVAKLLGSLGNLIYGTDPKTNTLAINLYIGSSFTLPGTGTNVSQDSDLPWAGKCSLTVKGSVNLALRIPAWASSYSCSHRGSIKNGYLFLSNVTDENVVLDFSVTARKMYAHPNTDKNEVCITRGPLVYCIEDVDNTGINIDTMALTDSSLTDGAEINIGSVQDVVTVKAKCRQLAKSNWSALYRQHPWEFEDTDRSVVAIPYFLRSNRGGQGAMRIWTKRFTNTTVSLPNGANHNTLSN